MSELVVGQDWYWVKRNGTSLHAVAFDNGPDYFVHGLCRGISHGKVGFFDRSFRPVIPAQFDAAFPFEHGRAEVCMGCKEVLAGEHRTYAGGTWGVIDRRGRWVEPLSKPEQAP